MIQSVYVGIMVLIAAASLGGLERLMNPDMRRFPCVNKRTIFILQGYTLCLALAAFGRLCRVYYAARGQGEMPTANEEQMIAATAMAAAHTALLVVVLKLRLNEGVWPRLQARVRRVQKLNELGGRAGGVLARAAAGVDAPPDIPPGVTADTLEKLARIP